MNPTANGRRVNPARYCEGCDDLITGEAHHHDGDLYCPPCWAERRAEDAREEAEEAEAEIQAAADELEERRREHEQALAELDAEYSEDLAGLRRRMQTWQRRANKAHRTLKGLGSIAAAVGASPAPTDRESDPFARAEAEDGSDAPWLEAAKARGEAIPAWCRPAPTDGPADGDRSIPADAVLVPPELEGLAPVRGGSGDVEPSEADWEDYREWAERQDAMRRWADEPEPEPDRPMWGWE